MRWALVCACALACGHAAPQSSVTVTPRASSASFRERTGPHHVVRDVANVEVNVHRLEGPESIILGFATIDRLAAACWRDEEALVIYPTNYGESVTLVIDTRPDGSMAEIELEPPTTKKTIAMCLIHALAAQPLHAEPGPQHLVLRLDARVWWT
jgi:hypothetical protein